ncbi:MAG: hypothetical protein NTU43_07550 [Bacteroidetes bacterium]|nr:hypothetical protein [Bacteroidota bacterium]
MNKATHTFISVLFHPAIVNLFNLIALFYLFPQLYSGIPDKLKWFYLLFIFISTSIIPIILVFVLKISGRVQTIMLHDREERRIPYLLTIFIYGFDYYNFAKLSANPIVLNYLLACMAVLIIIFIVNYFYKISIHTATLGSFLALLMVNFVHTGDELRPLVAITFVIIGLVSSARLFAHSHNTNQVYLGLIIGFVPMFIIL